MVFNVEVNCPNLIIQYCYSPAVLLWIQPGCIDFVN